MKKINLRLFVFVMWCLCLLQVGRAQTMLHGFTDKHDSIRIDYRNAYQKVLIYRSSDGIVYYDSSQNALYTVEPDKTKNSGLWIEYEPSEKYLKKEYVKNRNLRFDPKYIKIKKVYYYRNDTVLLSFDQSTVLREGAYNHSFAFGFWDDVIRSKKVEWVGSECFFDRKNRLTMLKLHIRATPQIPDIMLHFNKNNVIFSVTT